MKALPMALAIVGAAAAGGGQPPVGDWDFTAQAEIVPDRSGNGNGLRVEGCQWVQGKLGKALQVPARTGRSWCEDAGGTLRPAQAFGAIAWVRPLGTGQYGAVVRQGKGWGEEGTAGYRLLVYLEAEVTADFAAGKNIRLTPDEITAERYAKLEKCSLTNLPAAPFVRDRHTTLLAHMDHADRSDADYSRWEGRAGGWRLQHGVPGRFGLGVQLPSARPAESGAPILYRGGSNCDLRRGSCEFWLRAAEGVDLAGEDRDRYLLTIIPESHIGYGKRPGVHLVMRTHAATRSLQFAAHTEPISWYSHLNGAWIADSARTALHLPLNVLAGPGWHHVLCSWSMEGEGRIWLLVDGKGVTTQLATAPEPGRQIPCYKIFFGGSYFPEVYCPSVRAVLDEFRITDQTVAGRLQTYQAPSPARVRIDEPLTMQGEDLCRHFLDLTAKLQMGGGWEGAYTWPNLMPDESPGSYAAAAEDEYTMRHVTPAFLRAYEVLGDERYLRVAENCGQMLARTQDQNGAWCQGYIIMPDQAYPVSPGVGSIEEGTQTDPLRVLFWLWRITSQPAYRDAATRSAQFVLAGQKPDDLTGDDQYLAPLRQCARWGVNLPAQHRGYLYYHPASGEPITAKGYQIYRFSDPAFANAAPYRTSPEFFSRLEAQIRSRSNGPLIPGRQGLVPRREFERRAPLTREGVAAGLDAIRSLTEKPILHLAAFQRGEFPAGNLLNEHPRHGRHFWPGRGAPDVQRVLDYLQAVKVIDGELEATAVPGYADDYFGFIDPARDWYRTPLLRID